MNARIALEATAVRVRREPDEAFDGYLERLAEANHLPHPELRRLVDGERAGDPDWARTGGTQACGECLRTTGIWHTEWRHPWVSACVRHGVWLLSECPTCGKAFRSYAHSRLRPVEAAPGTCGNPQGARGRHCTHRLDALPTQPAPERVLAAQARFAEALDHDGEYAEDLTALAVLLLHLGRQLGGERIAEWAEDARWDHARSPAGRGARWVLSPPADPVLRGRVLADAHHILDGATTDESAERLGPWVDLTPTTNDGQLGWLVDHTRITPTLTRLVMAATSNRRRIATLLAHQQPVSLETIPQVLPAEIYGRQLADMIDVTDTTGRLYASLCLARRGRPDLSWSAAAQMLGLPADLGTRTARACSGDLLTTPSDLITALDHAAADLPRVDYRARKGAVRHLATRFRWYRAWARTHHPGSHATSRRYAVTWLWCHWAGGHLTTTPGWPQPPTATQRAYYRRWTERLTTAATTALSEVAETLAQRRTR